MNILRQLYNNIVTSTEKIRAVAMSLFIKSRYRSSAIQKFSYNKLHVITGLHANTCRKYVKILKDMRLVEFVGNNTIVFKKLGSRHQNKNLSLDNIETSSVKDIFYSLLALFNVEIVRHKEWAKHIVDTATDGYKNVRYAKRKSRQYGYGSEFTDNGLSFKTIAKKLNCCIQKAQHVITFATKYNFLNKHHNMERTYDEQARLRFACFPEHYHFATNNWLYVIKANTYTLGYRY